MRLTIASALSLIAAAVLAQPAAADLQQVLQFGTGIPGGSASQLNGPFDAVTDSDGTVYVADTFNQRISVFGPDGSFLRTFGKDVAIAGGSGFEVCTTACKQGTAGADAGEMHNPYAVALDGAGNLYVADNLNSRIDVYTTAGGFVRAFGWDVDMAGGSGQFENCTSSPCQAGITGDGPGQFVFPSGIAVGGGSVYVADGNNRISVLSTGGSFGFAFGKDVDSAGGFGGPEICATMCQQGVPDGSIGALSFPLGVAVGGGSVYVADNNNHRVAVFDTVGAFQRAFGNDVNPAPGGGLETCTTSCQAATMGGGAGELSFPSSIALSGGSLYLTESTNRVSEYTTGGGFVRAFGKDVDPAGGDGFEVCTTSCQAGSTGTGPGEFSYAEGVSVDPAGAILVSAYGTNRVAKLAEVSSPPQEPGTGGSMPSNDFSLGTLRRNKKKGTAEITVEVPGAGQLALTGDDVKGDSEQPASAGETTLTIRAAGAAKRALRRTGRVKLAVEVTYTPTGGSPNTKGIGVKLKKK
jgi:hypothetical protein